MGDLNGVVAQITIGLECAAFGDPNGVVRGTAGHRGGVQRDSETKRVIAGFAVDLSTVGVDRKIDGVVASTKIDNVFTRRAVLDEVVTTKGYRCTAKIS